MIATSHSWHPHTRGFGGSKVVLPVQAVFSVMPDRAPFVATDNPTMHLATCCNRRKQMCPNMTECSKQQFLRPSTFEYHTVASLPRQAHPGLQAHRLSSITMIKSLGRQLILPSHAAEPWQELLLSHQTTDETNALRQM